MLSPTKPVDLKCSETLRDSPPPPSSPSSVILSQTHPPSVHQQSNIIQPQIGSTLVQPIFSYSAPHFPQTQQASSAAVSLFLKRLDGQGDKVRPPSVFSYAMDSSAANRAASTNLNLCTGAATTSFNPAGSLAFGMANVVAQPSKLLLSHQVSNQQTSVYQPSSHLFPGFPLTNATAVLPIIQQQSQAQSHQIPINAAARPISTVLPSTTKSQPAVSPSKILAATVPTITQTRPLTLHVSTSRGPAVLQLQSSAAPAPSTSAKPAKLLSAGTTGPPTQQQAPASVVAPQRVCVPTSSILSPASIVGVTAPRILRPSPVHPIHAAILSQLPLNASAFGLTDSAQQHNHQQLQAAAAMIRSPIPGGGILPQAVAVSPHLSVQKKNIFTGPHLLPGSHTVTGGAVSLSPKIEPASADSSTTTSSPVTSTPATSTTVATPSPSRPSILRKRPSDLSNGANTASGAGSSAVKRLSYEPVTLARKANESNTTESESNKSIFSNNYTSTGVIVEHPEAGNSNHSSSASTVSAGSITETNGTMGQNISSPSPRKRPRKQQLNELAAIRGAGVEDEGSAPLIYCEPVEEETVVGPTGVGVSRYLPTPPPMNTPTRNRQLYPHGFDPQMGAVHAKSAGGSRNNSPMRNYQEQRLKKVKNERPYGPSSSLQALPGNAALPSSTYRHSGIQHQSRESKSSPQVPAEYRPRLSLLARYEQYWNPRRNHYSVYDDVKLKDDKRPTVVELSNQKHIRQKIHGWKLHLMAAQLDDVDGVERSNLDDLTEIYDFLNSCDFSDSNENKQESSEMDELKELVLTNAQRVRVIREHLDEGKRQLLNILEQHRPNVVRIIDKYTTKRPMRKKERFANKNATTD